MKAFLVVSASQKQDKKGGILVDTNNIGTDVVVARSEAEAVGMAITAAENHYPSAQGWKNSARAFEISKARLEEIIQSLD